jgi:DNA repair protein SbcC/Rad50
MRERVAILEPEVQRLHTLERERFSADAALAQRRQELASEIGMAANNLKHARDAASTLVKIESDLTAVKRKLSELSGCESELVATQAEHQSAVDSFSGLKAENERLQGEIAEMSEVVELLGSAGAACPVCGTDLSGDRRAQVEQRQRERLAALETRKRENSTAGAVARRQRDALQARVGELAEAARMTAGLREKEAQLLPRRDEAHAAAAKAAELTSSLAELQRRLAEDVYGETERAALAAIDTELGELRAIAEEHRLASAEIARLTEAQTERCFAEMQSAERSHAENKARLDEAKRDLDERQTRIASEQTAVAELTVELDGHDVIRVSAAAAQSAAIEADALRVSAQASVERLKQMISSCGRAREEATAKRVERDRMGRDRQAYTDLATAFGKRGVQALIIDNALPEIQEEANRLLARMTDNAMQVALSTLRQARRARARSRPWTSQSPTMPARGPTRCSAEAKDSG